MNKILLAKALYKETFEDTDKFINCIYENIIKSNNIISKEINGDMVSMINIIEKKLIINNELNNVWYLYAVATKKDNRRQGLMEKLLEKVFKKAKENNIKYIYLITSNPEYYKKYDFNVVGNTLKAKTIKEEDIKLGDGFICKKACLKDIKEMCEFSNEFLKKYEIYQYRDEEYYKKEFLIREAENSFYEMIYHKNDLIGIRIISKEISMEIAEEMYLEGYEFLELLKEDDMKIMFKAITNNENLEIKKIGVNDKKSVFITELV